ncbi:MAG: AsmA family protein [Thermodesulfobacteriota bacterium]
MLIVLTCLVLFSLVIALLTAALLPAIVSTDRARQTVVESIENALGHPVRIKTIDWSWRQGITIEGIRIAQPTDFSGPSMISADRAELDLQFMPLLKRRLVFSFFLQKPSLHLTRDKAGRINLPAAFAGEKSGKVPAADTESDASESDAKAGPVALPMDVAADMDLSGITVTWDDRQSGQKIRIENGTIRIKTASIANGATRLAAAADVFVNGEKLPRASIKAGIQNLFDENRQLRLQTANADLEGRLPGTDVSLSGDMGKKTVKGDISVDLAEAFRAAAPFAPEIFTDSTAGGAVDVTAELARAEDNTIGFSAELTGKDLSVSGKRLASRNLGPGDMGVTADGTVDLVDMALTLDHGTVSLLENSRLDCRATVRDLQSAAPAMDITVSPAKLDISEIAAFAKPFLPAALALGNPEAAPAQIAIDEIRLQGRLPAGRASMDVTGLAADLPGFKFRTESQAPAVISLADAGLDIQSFHAELTDLFPTAARINAAGRLGRVTTEASGNRISLDGLVLDSIELEADQLQADRQSPAGIAGKWRMVLSTAIDGFAFNDRLKLAGIEQAVTTRASFFRDGTRRATLERFDLDIADIQVTDPAVGEIHTSGDLEIGLKELVLRETAPLDIDVDDLTTRLGIGEMLTLDISADAEKTGRHRINAAAEADIDIAGLMQTIDVREKTGINAGGRVRLAASFTGKQPGPDTLRDLKAFEIAGNLDFLKHCRVNLSLSDGRIAYRPGNDSAVRVGQVSGSPLLSFDISNKPAAGKIASRIQFRDAADLLAIRPEKPVSGKFELDLAHTDGHRLEGRQQLTLAPGNIEQSIDMAFDGIKPTLAYKSPRETLEQINGRANAQVRIEDCAGIKHWAVPGLAPVTAAGAIGAAFGLRITPENTVAGRLRIDSQDMAAAMGDRFSVDGVNGAIEMAKTVTRRKSDAAGAAGVSDTLLSRQLMQGGRPGPAAAAAKDSKLSAVTGSADTGKGLSLTGARINAGGLPVFIGPSRLDAGLQDGLPYIHVFPLEVLGGSVTADAAIRQQGAGYALETRLNFTHLDPGIFFPEAAAGLETGASKISGAVYSKIPVSPDMQQVLENAQIRIDFRKIGRRAAERLLYAIDPHESNEAIVSQRRLLKNGTPKRIRLTIGDGFVSLEGELKIRGVTVALPRLNRLNIAQIPGIDDYQSRLTMIHTIVDALDLATAKSVSVVPSKSGSKSLLNAFRFR